MVVGLILCALWVLTVVGSYGWGVAVGIKNERAKARTPNTCGCTHHKSFHTPSGGCQEIVEFDSYGNPIRCGCATYVSAAAYEFPELP